jgi:hypothetical protein
MELMMWSLVRVMDALLREEGVVLNGVLFLCLWHNGLSLEGYFVQALWSMGYDFFLDQVKEVPNSVSG